MARTKKNSSYKNKVKVGLSWKHKRIISQGKRQEEAAQIEKARRMKEEKAAEAKASRPRDLGAMMRKQQKYNTQMAMNNMGNNSEADRKFTNMMRKHQNRVTEEGVGIFSRTRQKPTRAHGMKKGKKAKGKKKSKKSSKNSNRK